MDERGRPAAHITGAANSFGDYEEFFQGQSVTHTFAKSGVYPYVCVLHPTMVGAVVVGDGAAAEGASFGITPGAAARETSTSGDDMRVGTTAGLAGGTLAAVCSPLAAPRTSTCAARTGRSAARQRRYPLAAPNLLWSRSQHVVRCLGTLRWSAPGGGWPTPRRIPLMAASTPNL